MQDAQRFGAWRQDGKLVPAQSEPVPLDHRRIADSRGTNGSGDWD